MADNKKQNIYKQIHSVILPFIYNYVFAHERLVRIDHPGQCAEQEVQEKRLFSLNRSSVYCVASKNYTLILFNLKIISWGQFSLMHNQITWH
jgi:hypothetical protein